MFPYTCASAHAGQRACWDQSPLGIKCLTPAIQKLVNTLAFPPHGKHSCTEFFVLGGRTESCSVLQSPAVNSGVSKPQLESAGHQLFQVRLQNKLPKLDFFLKLGLLVNSKGEKKHGTVTMEKLGNLLLHQGTRVLRVLES